MPLMRPFRSLLILLLLGLALSGMSLKAQAPRGIQLDAITLPPGFEIALYAQNIDNARSMALSEDGTLFVGSRQAGKVYALRDLDGDFYAEDVTVIASGWDQPNGVALYDGDLYVAEITRLRVFDDIEANLENPPAPRVIIDRFNGERHHQWRFIRFSPDGKLYVPVGSPCDLCLVDQDTFGIISRMNPDGTEREIVARGVRHTVGFDFHPETGDLWFTDNGIDWLGDDEPVDELNHAYADGLHFGFPFCHAGEIVDPTYGSFGDCTIYEPPRQGLGPHVAALGMRFYTGEMFPEQYQGQVFIAEHGSMARSTPIGYRVTLVTIDAETGETAYEVFAEGWLNGDTPQDVWGRPVDVELMPDGSLLVSDDYADAIYRISYTPPAADDAD